MSGTRLGAGALARRGAIAAVVAAIANGILVVAVSSVGIAPGFRPLSLPPVLFLTVLGAVGATVAYWLIVGRLGRSDRTFVRVAVVVLVVSFIPDLGLLANDPAATVPGVIVLMAMHVIAAAASVSALTERDV